VVVNADTVWLRQKRAMIKSLLPPEGRMLALRGRFPIVCSIVILASFRLVLATDPQASHPETAQATKSNSSGPAAPVQVSTRMVTLEVVAKDRQGHHATGLTAADFQVFEQTPSRGKEKHEQKIAVFREVRMAELATQASSEMQVPAGLYTNLVAFHKEPIPPTILLVDGLNTEVRFQLQVHVQMLKMLRSLPSNVPVAVFLLGHRLRMLQGFTTDPSLLQAALGKAITTEGQGLAQVHPFDDPDEPGNTLSAPGSASPVSREMNALAGAAASFALRIYAATTDRRVSETVAALTALGRHLAGYPGRKNLLWISTSFPVSLTPPLLPDDLMRDYAAQVQRLTGVLSEAKVAVYPINPAGVLPPAVFDAGARPRDSSVGRTADAMHRETAMRNAEQDTMEAIAEGTGGRICTGDNDLSDCVHKAVDDSSTFYEIAYYPDSQNWNGEYRKIILKSRQSGLRLAYRDGYFARAEGAENATDQKTELQSACRDYLDATSIFLAAKRLPGESAEQLKFYLMANLSALTLAPTNDGGHELNVTVAACTFDKEGSPVQMMTEAVNRKLDAQAYQTLTAAGGFAHVLSIPGPKPAAVRLIVRDIPSGRLGSVHIKVDDTLTASPASRP
jgi:VWFA-related protein